MVRTSDAIWHAELLPIYYTEVRAASCKVPVLADNGIEFG